MPQYLLVYVRPLHSIDALTQSAIPSEARDLAVGAAREHVYACDEQGGAIKFSRRVGRFKPEASSQKLIAEGRRLTSASS